MKCTKYKFVRVYNQLRTVHLERAHEFAAASVIYSSRRYDFDENLSEGLDLLRLDLFQMVITLLRSRVSHLEVTEPLFLSGATRGAVAALVAKISACLRGERCTVVCYAIGNDDHQIGPGLRLRSRIGWRLRWVMGRLLARQVDRVVFGTPGSADLYERLFGRELSRAAKTLIPALPAPCNCGEPEDGLSEHVLFLGALQHRKGIELLMEAWPRVRETNPLAHLTIIGIGDLEPLVHAFTASTVGTSFFVDPPRDLIHRELRKASTVVLLSQRTPQWREQVGLPIVEGLAHGCSIITTAETGIARWLQDHGHEVLPSHSSAAQVAAAIRRVLQEHRDPGHVLDDLPPIDGRLAADAWLFRYKVDRGSPHHLENGGTGESS